MNLQYFTEIITHTSEFLCGPVDKLLMLLIIYYVVYMFLSMGKMYVNFIIFSAVKIYKNSVTRNSPHGP